LSPPPQQNSTSWGAGATDHLLDLLLLGLEAKGAHGDLTTGHLSGRQVAGEGYRGRQVAPCKIYSYYSGRRCASHLELLGVDGAGAVGIEEVEGLTDLLLLLLGEITIVGALLGAASTTVCLAYWAVSEQYIFANSQRAFQMQARRRGGGGCGARVWTSGDPPGSWGLSGVGGRGWGRAHHFEVERV
jgi:hypothetical protein